MQRLFDSSAKLTCILKGTFLCYCGSQPFPACPVVKVKNAPKGSRHWILSPGTVQEKGPQVHRCRLSWEELQKWVYLGERSSRRKHESRMDVVDSQGPWASPVLLCPQWQVCEPQGDGVQICPHLSSCIASLNVAQIELRALSCCRRMFMGQSLLLSLFLCRH